MDAITKRVHIHTVTRETAQSSLSSVVILIAILIVSGVRADSCPHHVTQVVHGHTATHGHACYLFVNKELYWDQARDACWDLGGEMLTIEDNDTMTFIKKTLESSDLGWDRNGVWLGAREESGTWRWTNGKLVTYTNWAEKQPKTFLGRTVLDCLQMRQEDNWKWYNNVCNLPKFHYNYICQFPLNKPGGHESRVSATDQMEDNGNSSILAVITGISVSLLLIMAIIFLVLFLRHRHRKQEVSGASAVPISNNVYHTSSIRTTHSDYETTSVSTNQSPLSSNYGLYLTPSEVIKPSHYLPTVNFLAKSCNCSHVQTGESNSVSQSPELTLKHVACGSCDLQLERKESLTTDVGRTKCELARAGGTAIECPHCCCSVSEGNYIGMYSHVLTKKGKLAKEDCKKHIYSNVDLRDGGNENCYEILH